MTLEEPGPRRSEVRPLLFAVALTGWAAVGVLVVSGVVHPLLNEGATVADGVSSALTLFVVTGLLGFALLLAYFGLTLLVTWLLRGLPRLLAGVAAGLVPALVFAGVSRLGDQGIDYVGSAAELAAADGARTFALAAAVAWCALGGALLPWMRTPARRSRSSIERDEQYLAGALR